MSASIPDWKGFAVVRFHLHANGVCRLGINPEELGPRSKGERLTGQLNGKRGTAIEAIDVFQSIPFRIDRIRFVGRTFVGAIPKD